MGNADRKQVNAARREFLHAAKGAGALGAIAVLFGKAPADASLPLSAQADDAPGDGYHETEHIRKYYRTARYW